MTYRGRLGGDILSSNQPNEMSGYYRPDYISIITGQPTKTQQHTQSILSKHTLNQHQQPLTPICNQQTHQISHASAGRSVKFDSNFHSKESNDVKSGTPESPKEAPKRIRESSDSRRYHGGSSLSPSSLGSSYYPEYHWGSHRRRDYRSPSPYRRYSRSPSPYRRRMSRSPSPYRRRLSRSPSPYRRRFSRSPSPYRRRYSRSPSPYRRRLNRSPSPRRYSRSSRYADSDSPTRRRPTPPPPKAVYAKLYGHQHGSVKQSSVLAKEVNTSAPSIGSPNSDMNNNKSSNENVSKDAAYSKQPISNSSIKPQSIPLQIVGQPINVSEQTHNQQAKSTHEFSQERLRQLEIDERDDIVMDVVPSVPVSKINAADKECTGPGSSSAVEKELKQDDTLIRHNKVNVEPTPQISTSMQPLADINMSPIPQLSLPPHKQPETPVDKEKLTRDGILKTWKVKIDSNGEFYYLHKKTGEISYTRPEP